MDNQKYLIVVVGPTAVGKTALSIELAHRFNTEIVSADSRQFYKEMNIGTAKPTKEELAEIRHHFVGHMHVYDSYSAGKFENEALTTINGLLQKNNYVIMTGGSGLFVDAVCKGFDAIPKADEEIRKRLNASFATYGLTKLLEELKLTDPEYYAIVDRQNPQRIIRALEVCISSGSPYSSFRKEKQNPRPFDIIKIGLTLPREELYHRINRRVDQMIQAGLVEEVQNLLTYKDLNALRTVGYTEIYDHLQGKTDIKTTIELIKQNTRRYAKRQLTWFKKDEDTEWFLPTDVDRIYTHIQTKMIKHV